MLIDNELLLVKIRPFKNRLVTQGKRIAILISFSWTDCLLQKVPPDVQIGLPLTLPTGRIISHVLYLKALSELLSQHDFQELRFILAGELQWSNLVLARGMRLDDIWAKQQASQDLYLLEKSWIQYYQPLIMKKLSHKNVTYVHWRDIANESGCQEQTILFHDMKKNIGLNLAYEKEVIATCKRESKKGRIPSSEFVRMYLDEEIPVLMNQVAPMYHNKADYLLYPARVPVLTKTFEGLEVGHGIWQEVLFSIKTRDRLYEKWISNGRQQILSPAEAIVGSSLDELVEYVKERERKAMLV